MVEASRVAEVIAELSDGTTTRGSGYRTADTAVLTAAHVVANAARVRVRFDADTTTEWATAATCQWSDTDADLAVLAIEPHADLQPARFGRVGDRDAVLPATAVGFPLWKLKNYDGTVVTDDGRPRYRDTHQAGGMVAVLSNRREGTLEFTVAPPARETDPETSPWQGMSGAALWIGDRIVGVVARHHRADGLGRLTAVRLTPEVLDVLGVTEPLADVGRPRVSNLILTDYRTQVAAIAPPELLTREDDLADLTRFVAGDEPYLWWQAGPWAGKSALMSWFVLHPPEGVDVVSFFVTGRLAAQDDSDAFTKELTLQLAALTGEHLSDVLTPDGRQNQLWRLLDEAAQRSRRLLVVIDGLDEDAGPAHGKPSIASLLPQRPPPGVRILIASRPDPQVPADVLDDDHPLLTCPRRKLSVSPHAQSKKRRAVHELNRHLSGDQLHRDVLGLITASGGGLTRGDLEELTNEPPYEIDRLLDGLLGRTIGSRPAPLRPEENKPVHLFAHETLAQEARDKFGASVRTYRDRIHAWANTFREKGWPPDTPQYLLLGYPHMLDDADDHDRLAAVSTDRARHDRMLLTTGGDALATSEVRRAQDVLGGQPSPDLSALLLLAVHSDELAHRNYGIPARLPLVWALLGDTTRADALARGIPVPETQVRSLTALARLAAATGEHDRFQTLVTDARAIANGLTESYARDDVLTELTRTAAAAGDPDLAISIAHDMLSDYKQGDMLAELAESAGADRDFGLALRFGTRISNSYSWTDTRAKLARSAAEAGEYEQAWPLLGEAAEHYVHTDMVKKFVLDAVAMDEYDVVHRFLAAATNPYARTAGLAAAAEAAAAKNEHEHALGFALGIAEPVSQVGALARLAKLAHEAGDHDRMTSLFEQAWARTNGIADHHTRARAAIAVLEEKPGADLPIPVHALLTAAEEFAQAVPDVKDRAALLHRLASVASAADDERVHSLLVESEQLINQIADGGDRERARIPLLWRAIDVGEHEWVSARLSGIADRSDRASATISLAEAVAEADGDRALALLTEVVTLARSIEVDTAEYVLRQMADAAVKIGAHEHVVALVNEIADTRFRNVALAALAQAAIEQDDHERAWSAAAHITDDSDDEVFAELSRHFVTAGDHDRALLLVLRIPDMDDQHRALTQLAEDVATAGEYERARGWVLRIDEDLNRTDAQASLIRLAAAEGAWQQAATIARDMAGAWTTGTSALADLVVAAEEAGELDLALTLARDLGSPAQLPELLIRLADTALSAGDRDRVRMLLTEIATATVALPESEIRFDVLVEAVGVAVAVGEHGQALALARQITELDLQAHALTQLAEAAAAEGDHQTARELVVEAEAVARNFGAAPQGAFTALVVASFLVGERERARGLVQGIPDRDVRARVLTELATATRDPEAVRSLLADAVTVAGDIPEAHARAWILLGLVDVAEKAGQADLLRSLAAEAEEAVATVAEDVPRVNLLTSLVRATAVGAQDMARSLLAEAESLAAEVPAGHSDKSDVQSELVEAVIAVGDIARARALSEEVADAYERHDALAKLARAADAAGDHELALTVVLGIDNSFRRHETLRTLVEQATVAGDHDRARTLVSTTTDWYQVSQMLTWLAQVATVAGDHERALSLVRDNPRNYGLSEGLVWLVRAAVARGDHERARGLADEIPEGYRTDAEEFLNGHKPAVPGLYSRIYPGEPLVDILIRAGDREQALIVTRDFDAYDRRTLLATLVDAEIAAGDLGRALAVAREITAPTERAAALSQVVEATAAAGDTAGTRTLLAEVLLLGQWHETVRLMARVAPDAVAPVLDELQSRCGA